MNILIVNFDECYNHGGVIQGWALQKVLQDMGHNVVRAHVPIPTKYPPHKLQLLWNIAKRFRRKYIIGDKSIEIFEEFRKTDFRYIPNHKLLRFIKKHIKTVIVNSMEELNGEDYDAVIVGSDQIWRRRYAHGQKLLTNKSACDNSFLAFTNDWNCKRIAYAASIGVDYWEYTDKETDVLKPLIKKLDAISVREDSAVGLIHKNLDSSVSIGHVLDPTLLIEKDEYIRLLNEVKEPSHTGDILLYILDKSEEKDDIISYIQNNTRLNTFRVNNIEYYNYNLPPQERTQPTMTSWLRGFHDTSMVITDSFHACVFSIIFEKPFYVILNEVRGATRIHSLLRIFGLQNRIIHSPEEYNTISKVIDWSRIKEIKKKWQEKSLDFLRNALNETHRDL